LRETGTAPTRKGSAARVTMVEKYILNINAVTRRGAGQVIKMFKDGPASPFIFQEMYHKPRSRFNIRIARMSMR